MAAFLRHPFKAGSSRLTPTPLTYTLPDLDVNNQSLQNLLDQFASYESASSDIQHNNPPTKTLPVVPIASQVASNNDPICVSNYGDTQTNSTAFVLPTVARNDSSGSSNSSLLETLPRSPVLSRTSSQTTVSQILDDDAQEKLLDDRNAVSTLSQTRVGNLLLTNLSSSSSSRLSQRTNSTMPSILVVALPPDKNKPLPPAPDVTVPPQPPAKDVELQPARPSAVALFEVDSTPLSPRGSQHPDHNRKRSGSIAISNPAMSKVHLTELPGTSSVTSMIEGHKQTAIPISNRTNLRPSTMCDRPEFEPVHRSIDRDVKLPFTAPIPRRKSVPRPNRLRQLPDVLVQRILCQVDEISDLVNTTSACRQLWRIFKEHESDIVSPLIYRKCRAAWEACWTFLDLKNMQNFTLQLYLNSRKVVHELKTLIGSRCISICKPDTLRSLAGFDPFSNTDPDLALWRIWTFSNLFGRMPGCPTAPVSELEWLQGVTMDLCDKYGFRFISSPKSAYSMSQLEDMSEMWLCLQSLLSPFSGRESEARVAGIFGDLQLSSEVSETHYLGEWMAFTLTQGLPNVLHLSSGSFRRAKRLGLTHWTPLAVHQTYSLFLISPLSKVYEEQVLAEARLKAAQIILPPGPLHRPESSCARPSNAITIPTRHHTRVFRPSLPEETPDSVKPADPSQPPQVPRRAVQKSGTGSQDTLTTPSGDPSLFYVLNPTGNASTKVGPNLFPVQYETAVTIPSQSVPNMPGSDPTIIDPIDRAMHMLVQQLGYPEADAKRALATSDTGTGVDVDTAVMMLEQQKVVIDDTAQKPATTTKTPFQRCAEIVTTTVALTGSIGSMKIPTRRSVVNPGQSLQTVPCSKSTGTTESFYAIHYDNDSPLSSPDLEVTESSKESNLWRRLGSRKQIRRRASDGKLQSGFTRSVSVKLAALSVKRSATRNLNGLGLIGVHFSSATER